MPLFFCCSWAQGQPKKSAKDLQPFQLGQITKGSCPLVAQVGVSAVLDAVLGMSHSDSVPLVSNWVLDHRI